MIYFDLVVSRHFTYACLSNIFIIFYRTDFYYVPDGPYQNMGFPPGVAEELVMKVLRTCDPKNWKAPNGAKKPADVNNEIMCSTVAHEEEVVAEEDETDDTTLAENNEIVDVKESKSKLLETNKDNSVNQDSAVKNVQDSPENTSSTAYVPPVIPTQKNSETYNGAERDNYSWSQTIMDLGKSHKTSTTFLLYYFCIYIFYFQFVLSK